MRRACRWGRSSTAAQEPVKLRFVRGGAAAIVVALVAALGVSAALAAASDPVRVRPGERVTVADMAARTKVLVNSCGDGQEHAGPTYSTFRVLPPGAATVLGAKPSVHAIRSGTATGAIIVAATATPGTSFVLEWGAVADGCYSAGGSVTFIVAGKSSQERLDECLNMALPTLETFIDWILLCDIEILLSPNAKIEDKFIAGLSFFPPAKATKAVPGPIKRQAMREFVKQVKRLGPAKARELAPKKVKGQPVLQTIFELRTKKGNFTIASRTRGQAEELGRAWVGPNAKQTVTTEGEKILLSTDGLRQYRFPTLKQSGPHKGQYVGNLEEWPPSGKTGKPIRDVHVPVTN
jgi:hypothetical protein